MIPYLKLISQIRVSMYDPTNSRYRYLKLKSNHIYRRFIQKDRKLEYSTLVQRDLVIPAHGTYGALLFTAQWKSKRQEILKRDDFKCTICNDVLGLQIHHRQYHFLIKQNEFRLPWEYSNDLLITLCESCHKRGHSKFKVPTIII